MLTRSVEDFVAAVERTDPAHRATMDAAMLIQPNAFALADDAAADNKYMNHQHGIDRERALVEHARVAGLLASLGLPVLQFRGLDDLCDATFCNNVFGAAPGRLIVGTMCHPSRKPEREHRGVRELFRKLGMDIVDVSGEGVIAELTGPMVIDRARRVGWCGMTQRVTDSGARAMAQAFDLSATLCFDLKPDEYHTNVVLSVLAGRAAVVCGSALGDPAVVDALERVYEGRVLRIDERQKSEFAGNCLAATDDAVVLSKRALDALTESNRRQLESWGFSLHAVDLSELENSGGSMRCLIGELFLS